MKATAIRSHGVLGQGPFFWHRVCFHLRLCDLGYGEAETRVAFEKAQENIDANEATDQDCHYCDTKISEARGQRQLLPPWMLKNEA